MATNRLADKEALDSLRVSFGLSQMIPCSKAECAKFEEMRKNGGALPEGVFSETDFYNSESTGRYYRVLESGLTEGERKEYLSLMRLKRLKSINGHLIFYTTLIILQIVILVIALVMGAYGAISLIN